MVPRRLKRSALLLLIITSSIIILYQWIYTNSRTPISITVNNLRDISIVWYRHSENQLEHDSMDYYPMEELLHKSRTALSFTSLPLRKPGWSFTEVTSFDPDTSKPDAPDFTFVVRFEKDRLVLFEGYGPGCVHRVWLLPTIGFKNYLNDYIQYNVDGTTYEYSLGYFQAGDKWPFLVPLGNQPKSRSVGVSSHVPICFQESMQISFKMNSSSLIPNLFSGIINCAARENTCPRQVYSAVSRIKFPQTTRVEVFQGEKSFKYRKRAESVARLMQNPEEHGPDRSCHLTCVSICKGCKQIVLDQQGSGVISAIKMRVFESSSMETKQFWTDIWMSITFDDAVMPQINRVPLGSFFGATASLNQFKAAVFGKLKKNCTYKYYSISQTLPSEEITGYLFIPMPYWKSVKILLEGTIFIDSPALVCHQVAIVPNQYQQISTGYFHARKTYYDDISYGWRELVEVNDSWGHVIGVLVDLDKADRRGQKRPVFEADPVIYVDGVKSPTSQGTGFEDYFSSGHGWLSAVNVTYAFVGDFHGGPQRNLEGGLTRHAYRLQILDPIYFTNSLRFIWEGMDKKRFQTKQPELGYEEYVKHRATGAGCVGHLVWYYAGNLPGWTESDKLNLGSTLSEKEHNFIIRVAASNDTGSVFHLNNISHMGASLNETFSVDGRHFKQGDKFSFQLHCLKSNQGVVLRRESYSKPVESWNELAKIWVDGLFIGQWFLPKGALLEKYSLRQEDFIIDSVYTKHKNVLTITVGVMSGWRDISYTSYSII